MIGKQKLISIFTNVFMTQIQISKGVEKIFRVGVGKGVGKSLGVGKIVVWVSVKLVDLKRQCLQGVGKIRLGVGKIGDLGVGKIRLGVGKIGDLGVGKITKNTAFVKIVDDSDDSDDSDELLRIRVGSCVRRRLYIRRRTRNTNPDFFTDTQKAKNEAELGRRKNE